MKSKSRKIVITSTGDNFKSVRGRIEAAGFEPVLFSTIKIIPLAFRVKTAKYDWVIFTSKNAVKYFTAKAGKNFFKGTDIAAIGSGTAGLLEKKGLKVSFTPAVFDSGAFVREFAEKYPVKGLSILLPSSKISGKTMIGGLRKAGGRVTKLAVYDTIMPIISRQSEAMLQKRATYHFILFSSPSAFRNFMRLRSAAAALGSSGTAAMGRATAAEMRKAGITPDITGDKHTIAGLVDEILKRR